MRLRADLHLHSCLSPCGSLEMSPAAIARTAHSRGLNAIALTDHNCARNAPAFAVACRRYDLLALFGVEVTTSEELHALCIFDRLNEAVAFGDDIFSRLPPIRNLPDKMGDQVVVDMEENILEHIPVFLGSATDITLTDLSALAASAGALFIPAHIDRPSFSLMSQLGTIPDIACDALEITPSYRKAGLTDEALRPHALIYSSDAHYLDAIGQRWIEIECRGFNLPALKTALSRARRIVGAGKA